MVTTLKTFTFETLHQIDLIAAENVGVNYLYRIDVTVTGTF